jgi:hypothetical protein
MARLQFADGRDRFQIWRVAANILNKHSRTADKRWSSSFCVGHGVNDASPQKLNLLRNVTERLGLKGSCEHGNELIGIYEMLENS